MFGLFGGFVILTPKPNGKEHFMKSFFVICLVFLSASLVRAEDFKLCDEAMSQVGMKCEDIRFDQDEMANWGGDLWRTHYFTMFHQNPFKLPKYGQLNLKLLSDNIKNISSLLAWGGSRIDCPVRRGLIDDQLKKYISYPDSTPKPSFTQSQKILSGKEFALLKDKIDFFYRLVNDSSHIFVNAINDMTKKVSRQKLFDYFIKESEEPNYLIDELMPYADLNHLVAGCEDIAEVVKRMADSIEYASFPKTKIEFSTPQGLIVIGTSGSDKYEYNQPPLLIIDGGGDDIYRFSGYPEKYPLSVIIDVSGNDKYISTDSTLPGIGGAVAGMSVVIDKSGNDYYSGINISQGAGVFGVGILLDSDGNDIYSAKAYSQAAGAFGVGILADSSGNDSLYCVTLSQGMGYTKGCGILVNYEGNDKYIAEDSIITYPSQQSAKHNTSLAQGFGFGKRADFVDGHSWAGGVGILCDVKGNDYYSDGVFGQGCGYWFAVGMLLDGEGDDNYNCAWYSQGSAAHFAVGYLDDFAGNDTYVATDNLSIGAGHDFSIGFLNERSGNDIYNAPYLSLGGGNANGMGLFFDHSGDDVYTTKGGVTLGRVNPLKAGAREFLNCFGVFIDGGGNDTYDQVWAKNGTKWISPKVDSTSTGLYEIGVGIDK
jgi:hypothetical protein